MEHGEELSKQRNIYRTVPEAGTCRKCSRNNKKASIPRGGVKISAQNWLPFTLHRRVSAESEESKLCRLKNL